MNNTNIKLLIGAILFGTLVALTVLQTPHAERLVDMIYGALVGMGIMHIGQSAPATAPESRQGGFARPSLLIATALLAITLTGCAAWQQAVQTYGTVAVTNAKAANDTIIEAQKVTLCGLPLSAIARHPEIIPAVRALCVASNDANMNALLDAIELKSAKQ